MLVVMCCSAGFYKVDAASFLVDADSSTKKFV